jgi:cytochrome c556
MMIRSAVLGAGVVVLAGCGSPQPQQTQPAAPQTSVESAAPTTATPKVSINAVMVALVDHAGHNLWDVEREGAAPKTDAAWQVVQEHAVQIVAAGPAITVGGTGPMDANWVKVPTWRAHAQRMSDAGAAALAAANAKNFDALVVANGQLVESCESCHKEFKPDLPSEGIAHAHAH